ncbi:hypothetical protein [Salinicola sp. DM10]|uniref:hypothetical protein n=1 Tax=Salinicola sp. DM10 TaxID=2815721 RepID=UPI001A8ED155|nr:hypothetical protein [Salinicola sp. DM10]MCE3027574.1 hypothetical protein [Salinicola sp. DM10]
MTSAHSHTGHTGARWRPRQRAHWWLASVLVGCLLPAGLVQAEALRLAERLAQVYLMAPEEIRAESRRVARAPTTHPQPPRLALPALVGVLPALVAVRRLAHDAFSRRGPPLPV